MVTTTCLSEAKYLLERAMRTRGITPTIVNRTFTVSMTIGRYSVSFMPGNRRTLIFHESFIEPQFRGKGLGRKGLALREEMARETGATLLLATVRDDNKVENELLLSSGWSHFTDNLETGVSLWGKRL